VQRERIGGDLQPRNSQDQPAFSLFWGDAIGRKPRIAAGMTKASGCFLSAFSRYSGANGRGFGLAMAAMGRHVWVIGSAEFHELLD
jgi:hypothetical protein